MGKRKSTPKREPLWWDVFMTEYMSNGQNGRAAYMKARPGTPSNTAGTMASRLLNKVEFRSSLDRRLQKVAEKLEMTREEWLKLVADVGRFNLPSFLRSGEQDDVRMTDGWQDHEDAHCIESFQTATTTNEDGQVFTRVSVKAHNKMKALEVIGKALGYLTDKVEHSGNVTLVMIDPYAEPKDSNAKGV